jgi:hypothetical protein
MLCFLCSMNWIFKYYWDQRVSALPSGHIESCDFNPLHCWLVTYFDVFLCFIVRILWQLIWLIYCLKAINSLKQNVYASKQQTQTLPDPTLHTPTTDSGLCFIFFHKFCQYLKWLCVGELQKTILCLSYMHILVLMCLMMRSLIQKLPLVTSPQLVQGNDHDLICYIY